MEAVPSRRTIASIIVTFVGIVALGVAGVSTLAGGQVVSPPGQCPAGFEKALSSAPGNGQFATFVYKGVTISTADGFTANFSSPVANVSGFSVGGGSNRNTETYAPPVSSQSVASPNNSSGNQAAISNLCIRFGTPPTTPTTAGPTTTTTAAGPTTTAAGPTTTAAVSPTTVVGAGDDDDTEVRGVVVESGPGETPRAAPEELAFTGVGNSTALFAALGVMLISFGVGLAWAGRRETALVHHDR